MLGDASSNVHMQYLREGVLMTEAEENKLNQTSFNKVNRNHDDVVFIHIVFVHFIFRPFAFRKNPNTQCWLVKIIGQKVEIIYMIIKHRH